MKDIMKIRDHLHELFKSNRQDPLAENNYKTKKKIAKQMLSEKKVKYFKEEFTKSKGNIKGTWEVINRAIPLNKIPPGSFSDTSDEQIRKPMTLIDISPQLGKIHSNDRKKISGI